MKEIGFGIVGTGSIASRFARACAMAVSYTHLSSAS